MNQTVLVYYGPQPQNSFLGMPIFTRGHAFAYAATMIGKQIVVGMRLVTVVSYDLLENEQEQAMVVSLLPITKRRKQMPKGMHVNIYRTNMQCTNGVTAVYDEALLIGEGVPEVFDSSDKPILKLVRRRLFGSEHLHAEPVEPAHANRMFGGNFIYTSDSRFPNPFPFRFMTAKRQTHTG